MLRINVYDAHEPVMVADYLLPDFTSGETTHMLRQYFTILALYQKRG